MHARKIKKAGAIFWLLVGIELAGHVMNIEWVHYIVKPLLMPSLIFLIQQSDADVSGKKLLIPGLIFSWAGDVLLLFESKHPLFFILGLASFLLTHVCYIIYFLSNHGSNISLLKKQPVMILFVIAYGIGLFYFLLPHLGDLKIPVLVYAVVICSMLLATVHIYFNVNEPSNKLYVGGALLFVVSDSLLAVNKFYHPIYLSGVLIMLTYCMAQYFIVAGFVREKKTEIKLL
jgi:uncharacterized membrane protein YhhN